MLPLIPEGFHQSQRIFLPSTKIFALRQNSKRKVIFKEMYLLKNNFNDILISATKIF